MHSTIVGLCESKFGFAPKAIMNNRMEIDTIDEVSEDIRKALSYDIKHVSITEATNKRDYYIEFSNNLERYIKDQKITFEEAIDNICEEYNLIQESLVIVIDESCIDKLDITALKEEYNVKRI